MTKIGIIGTGPSALYTLQGLLRSTQPLEIALYEAGPIAGMGIPYSPLNNDRSMLANIASIELPPLSVSLQHWLTSLPDAQLEALGVERNSIGPRTFFPRIVLGAYFSAGLNSLMESAARAGHNVCVLTSTRVVDVRVQSGGTEVVAESQDRTLTRQVYDHVVIATGHRVAKLENSHNSAVKPAYDATRNPRGLFGRIGVLGTSLSAIDVAVATAQQHGAFNRDDAGKLQYRLNSDGAFSLTLMSRGGRLPEADFYCPIPYEPLDIFTEAAVDRLIAGGNNRLLDALFELFKQQLSTADPAYAVENEVAACTADTFHRVYFALRMQTSPFDWAAKNLAETRANAAAHHTVQWRYAILRMHEVFAKAVPHFSPSDATRFSAGLKGVFIDNYAAVPPESVERLLALHEAGVLTVERLGADYSQRIDDDAIRVVVDGRSLEFDQLIDARGQSALGIDDLPFPSLRMKLRANRLRQPAEGTANVSVTETYRLLPGLNPLDGIYFLSMPFLLSHNPFIQGLTSAHEMGEIASAHIIETEAKRGGTELHDDVEGLKALREIMLHDTTPVFCLDSGLVVLH